MSDDNNKPFSRKATDLELQLIRDKYDLINTVEQRDETIDELTNTLDQAAKGIDKLHKSHLIVTGLLVFYLLFNISSNFIKNQTLNSSPAPTVQTK